MVKKSVTKNPPSEGYTLTVPLDASRIEDNGAAGEPVKVVARGADGSLASQIVKLGRDGKGQAIFDFSGPPSGLTVFVGPYDAEDVELAGLQTLKVDVTTRLWSDTHRLELAPLVIHPYYWNWWRRWCRTFVVRGRVVCPDGSPVPAAEVTAFDVDWFWWWRSRQFVGSSVTDLDGNFEIKFRWCCGWWPWWWWRRRLWEIDRELLEKIVPVIRSHPDLVFDRVSHQPSLKVFSKVLDRPSLETARLLDGRDLAALEKVREQLIERLPKIPEFRELRIWPWWPWRPWWDCTPDLIFKVTQDCGEGEIVVLEEGYADTRWNVPNPLSVNLTVTDDACCAEIPTGGGHCLTFTNICRIPIDDVGGNTAAPATLIDGYAVGDRPFAGRVNLRKHAEDMTGVDYYEIEVDDGSGSSWQPLPAGAAMDFRRRWLRWDSATMTFERGSVPFNFGMKDGHLVVESREHFESHGPFSDWVPGPGASRVWTSNAFLVVPLDSTKFADGTYTFRVVGYQEDAAGHLIFPGEVLPICGTTIDNWVKLTFDNRLNPDPAHPAAHPCGSGTIHLCTTEPDTDFVQVLVNGTAVDPCGVVNATTGTLEIVFDVTDPDEHLAAFSLRAHWGENQVHNLLNRPSAVLTKEPGTAYLGPTYSDALADGTPGAPRPHWGGGRYRLTVDMADAFPEPCCYLLRLRAWKRTIVNCEHDDYDHRNWSEYTIGVGVCPPLPSLRVPEVEREILEDVPVRSPVLETRR